MKALCVMAGVFYELIPLRRKNHGDIMEEEIRGPEG